MDVQDIIDSLREQARDKDALSNKGEHEIFVEDAKMLRQAADILDGLQKLVAKYEGRKSE